LTFILYFFSVDLVSDAAIRHENGKQVARWNVDPTFSNGNETPTSSVGYASALVAANGLPSHHQFLTLSSHTHVPHPITLSANRTQAYTTGQLSRHPNGKGLMNY